MSSIANKSRNFRQALRQQRQQLSHYQQQRAATELASHLTRLPVFLRSKRIAFYLPNDGEIDPTPAMAIAEAAGKHCFLPVLHPLKFNRLYFSRYQTGQELQNNRFGIPEPPLQNTGASPAWSLDLILLPLVAFDSLGNRLGMGGGFYDRTLAFTLHNSRACPQLLGLAHHFQQVADISRENWDIPLQGIVTDHGLIQARKNQLKQ